MPESVFTQTIPLGLAGGVSCCAVALEGAEDVGGLDWFGAAVGVGLLAGAGAGAFAGTELGAGVFAAGASADFFDCDFFVPVVPESLASAVSALSADFLEGLFFAVVEEPAAVRLSVAASADFLEWLFFVLAAGPSVAAVGSAASALLFLERLFFVPESAAARSAVFEESAEFEVSADFLDWLFLAVLPLSAVAELSAESVLALFLDRPFLVVVEESAAESAWSAVFFLDLDPVLAPALESASDCDESSALTFFLDFFLVVVELSL